MITKFAFATTQGFIPGNPYKVNQDAYVLTPNLGGNQGLHFFAVCDGHGLHGKPVSGFVKEELPGNLFLTFSLNFEANRIREALEFARQLKENNS